MTKDRSSFQTVDVNAEADHEEKASVFQTCIACCICLLCTPCIALGCCVGLGNTAVKKAQGKRWDAKQHRWVVDDLTKDADFISKLPDDDRDILKDVEVDEKNEHGEHDLSLTATTVKETEYYDALSIPTDADEKKIKRAYYVNARKYHPDRNGGEEAKEKFQIIGEAYQVLSDPKLRAVYDKEGKEGLSGDKTSVSADKVDPSLIFTFLFGSDSFTDIIGRLLLVTQTMVADPSDTTHIGMKDTAELENRRVIRLALKLRDRIQLYVEGEEERAKSMWDEEAAKLVDCRYGEEILNTVGATYRLVATQLQGTWTEGLEAKVEQNKINMDAAQQAMEGAKQMEDGNTGMGDDTLPTYINMMWSVTVIDITSTIRETVSKVCRDKSVPTEVREKRAAAIRELGEIFEKKKSAKKGQEERTAGALFQSATVAAMEQTLEKMRREEEHAVTETQN